LFVFLRLQNQTVDQDQLWGKDDPCLEGIEVKFQRDQLRGFEWIGILPNL